MPIVENFDKSNFASTDGAQASLKLSNQAIEAAALATLATTALILASKGKFLPELAPVAKNSLLGAKVVAREALESAPAVGKSIMSRTFESVGSAVNKNVIADIELGARPGWQFAKGAKTLEAKYLDFTRGWPVEGVSVNKEGVNLFTSRNHHWVKIGPFDKPTADVHALDDLLNTYIANVRTGGASGKEVSSLVLKRDTASAFGTELTGRLKPIEFWL